MRIGVDMVALQSPDSRLRGVGRYGRNFLAALLERDPGLALVLYAHEGLPTDTFPDSDRAEVVTLRPRPEDDERLHADALERVAREGPDDIDALLMINPFELMPRYAPPPRALHGPPLLAVVYDLIPFLHQEQYLADPGHARRMYRHLDRLRPYDLLLTISASTRADCLRVLGLPDDRVAEAGTASDPSFFTPDRSFPIPEADRRALAGAGVVGPFLFSVSGMDERKNWRGLIDAFAALPAETRATHQLVVTCTLNEAYAARIREHAERRGVGPRLVLTGAVDDRTLRTLYRRCAVFALPSLCEGFGLPLLEAMHCGAPVVAANNSAMPEVVGDAGLLASAEDAGDLASKLAAVLDDPCLADDLRSRAERRAAGFSWLDVADRALAAIRRTLGRGEGAPTRRRKPRPRIAMFSPWPPKASGISDYSARLVRELSGEYAVDLYHEPGYVPEVALGSGEFACIDYRLFPRYRRAIGYRGVVHQMGNSFYHGFVWEAMQRFPGITVLHDFNLAGFQFWRAHLGGDPSGELRDEMAYCEPRRWREIVPRFEAFGREPGGFQEALTRRGLHMNRRVFEASKAIVVHSPWCLERATDQDPRFTDKTVVIPHGSTAAVVPEAERVATRDRFGIPRDALVVGSFGILTQAKMNVEALRAFRALADLDPKAVYILVGMDWEGGQARRAAAELGLLDRVRFLGRQPAEEFDALVPVADVGISLRRPPTYGETSGALLHLLRHGVPTIVNDVGTFADYPDDVVRKVDMDAGGVEELARTLLALAADPPGRRALGLAAHQYVARRHSWPLAASLYVDLIERVNREGRSKRVGAPARVLLGA